MSDSSDLFPDFCIETAVSKDKDGYGRLRVSKYFNDLAHRLVYRIFKGEIPTGLVVMHACDNPSCCNPRHLMVGTQQDNVVDAIKKGRRPQNPASHKNTKITTEDVYRIRAQEMDIPTGLLAKKYGVSDETIRRIKKSQAWKGITPIDLEGSGSQPYPRIAI